MEIVCEEFNLRESYLFFPGIRKEEFKTLGKKRVKTQTYEERDVNVFEEWKTDTDETHKAMLDNDFKYWKLYRLVKDQA